MMKKGERFLIGCQDLNESTNLQWKFSHCKRLIVLDRLMNKETTVKYSRNTRIYVEKPLLQEKRKKTTGKLGFHYILKKGYKRLYGG